MVSITIEIQRYVRNAISREVYSILRAFDALDVEVRAGCILDTGRLAKRDLRHDGIITDFTTCGNDLYLVVCHKSGLNAKLPSGPHFADLAKRGHESSLQFTLLNTTALGDGTDGSVNGLPVVALVNDALE